LSDINRELSKRDYWGWLCWGDWNTTFNKIS